MVTVSEDSAALLRYTFPQLDIKLARSVIDPRRFHPGEHPGGRRIAYMPRRRHAEREQLLHVMRSRGILDGWELVPIDGRTEDETAELMRSCAIFLSFSEREGFGLPPAEAMASGCYVVGYTGNGGRDYFDPVYCSPVPECDLLAYAMAVEEAIRRYESDPESLAKAGRLASERILGQYHEAGLKADLTTLYGQLLTEWPAERQL
jgi:glycosyltransferase involved in cell wall biosynthesis